MKTRWRAVQRVTGSVPGRAIALLSAAPFLTACQTEWLLRVRDPGGVRVEVDGAPATRRPLAEQSGRSDEGVPFSDREIDLGLGKTRDLDRHGDWIISSNARAYVAGAFAYVDFHVERRRLPPQVATVSTAVANTCELRIRTAPPRGIGWFALLLVTPSLAGGAAAAALLDDEETSSFAPYLAGAAATSLLAGAALALWPAGEGSAVVTNGCQPSAR